MKSTFSQRGSTLAMTAIASGILVACSGGGGSSAGAILPPVVLAPAAQPPVATSITVSIVDETGDVIDAADLRVLAKSSDGTTAGDAQRLTRFGQNSSQTTFTPVNGALALGLIEAQSDLTADPLDVVLVAQSNDYVSSSSSIDVDVAGDYNFKITMVNKTPAANIPVAAIPPKVVTQAAADGTTAGAISEATPPRAAGAGTAEVKGSGGVSIDQGTKILVDNGNGGTKEASAGDITLNVAYFENDIGAGSANFVPSDGALTVFPGGLDVQVNAANPAAPAQGSFSTAGFIAVDLRDSDGNVVTNFEDGAGSPKEITINITIPEGTPNPDPALDTRPVGAPDGKVNVGEFVPVWSYNELTGKWESEKDNAGNDKLAEVTDTDPNDGVFNVSFTTTHLSYFNLDFYGARCTDSLPGGRISATIVDSAGQPNLRIYDFSAYQVGGGWSRYKNGYEFNSSFDKLDVFRAPSFGVTVEILDATDVAPKDSLIASMTKSGTTVNASNGKLSLQSLCDLNGAEIRLNSANPTFSAVDVVTVEACEQDQSITTVVPTRSYFLVRSPYFYQASGTRDDGRGRVEGLTGDRSYEFWAVSRQTGRYKQVSASVVPDDLTDGSFTAIVDTVECDIEDPTGATGGTGAGGTGQ